MSTPLSHYALLSNTSTAALVSRGGSVDWFCAPRFDSAACFAALLGTEQHGRWLLRPAHEPTDTRRQYRSESMVLDTVVATAQGRVRVTDALALGPSRPTLVRQVKGLDGDVVMTMELRARFDYGSIVPWVTRQGPIVRVVAGPDALVLRAPVEVDIDDHACRSEFTVAAGETVSFVLQHQPSFEAQPVPEDADGLVRDTVEWWTTWMQRCTVTGRWAEPVRRSALTLKALSYSPTGAVVAAPTASLPESLGGNRNWDYRYCWLRDATFTLYALLLTGFREEARAWREWLLRAVAGRPDDLQILYGIEGERRIPEWEVPWLPGYEGSAPVRIGNAASRQLQLDVYGEVLDALHLTRRAQQDLPAGGEAWSLQRAMVDFLEQAWTQPDASLWEVRGPHRHFTYSKVMAWVAFDRAAKAVDVFGLPGPAEHWRSLARQVRQDVYRHGYDPQRRTFVQSYGSDRLDAALLMLPLIGFLPPDDERMVGTVAAIERELLVDGLVLRYRPDAGLDALEGPEGTFLPCSFWLADNYALQGRRGEAEALFERLLDLANDVGLLSEEYDVAQRRLVGNFPQAFTHVSLINTAHNLTLTQGPAKERAAESGSS